MKRSEKSVILQGPYVGFPVDRQIQLCSWTAASSSFPLPVVSLKPQCVLFALRSPLRINFVPRLLRRQGRAFFKLNLGGEYAAETVKLYLQDLTFIAVACIESVYYYISSRAVYKIFFYNYCASSSCSVTGMNSVVL